MLGQMIVARFSGPVAPQSLLTRIASGQVGGVILFADNLAGGLAATAALTQRLQRAARAGGNPPLLIMTDQEGGEVKRLPGPPWLAPAQMTSASVAFAQGKATGVLLRRVGINVDLAPVADVERAAGSFLGTRAFGSSPALVAQRACAFARGLAGETVGYTLKHFPGLGRAVASTDAGPVSITASPAALRSDYAAYRACAASPLALVMVSSATYPNLTGPLPAVMSPLTYRRELPLATGGSPVVTISDDLQAGALAGQQAPARHAIGAGVDLLLYASTQQASADAYDILLQEARAGALSRAGIQAAYEAIAALKARLGAAGAG
jgi:beta-N-acetylhexosaminidase